jgi:aspartate aminotransferase
MNVPMVSQRTIDMPLSAVRKLVPLANAAKNRGVRVYHLNIGQPDIETPSVFWDAVSAFSESTLAYAPSVGRAECISGWIEYYGHYDISLAEKELIVTTAGSESLLLALMACGDIGDEVIVPEPYYTNYNGLAAMAGLRLVPVPSSPETGYRMPSRDAIEQRISERTRGILFSSPGNPTGVVYERSELAMAGDLALSHGLFVLSDEVYREFTYDGKVATSVLHLPELEQNAVVLDSVSKRYSACGARIGCVVSRNEQFMSAVRKLAMARLSSPVLEQIGIAACLRLEPSYFDAVRDEYALRRDIVCRGVKSIEGAFCPKPAGAFYAMARFDGIDTEDFARWLLTDFEEDGETVMIAPGAGFYGTAGSGANEIRIAYVLEAGKLSRAMGLLAHAVERYRGRRS